MSVYEELMNEKMPEEGPRRSGDQGGGHSSGRGGVREKPLTPEERAQYEAAQRRAAARKIPYPKGSAGETGEPTQSTRSDASTEHEGPSLKEKVKYLAEIARLAGPGPATDVRRNPGTSEKGKRARRRSSGETHGTSLGAHMLKVTHPETGVNAGTEHEGPSLREKLARLKEAHVARSRGIVDPRIKVTTTTTGTGPSAKVTSQSAEDPKTGVVTYTGGERFHSGKKKPPTKPPTKPKKAAATDPPKLGGGYTPPGEALEQQFAAVKRR